MNCNLPNLITPAELADRLDDPELLILDCRFDLAEPNWGQAQYQTSHIPGAFYLDLNRDLSSPVKEHGGRHPLPDVHTLTKKLNHIGLTARTQVIAYDQGRLAYAARLWWLLRYLGHPRVTLLTGGWDAYVQGGYPVGNATPHPHPGDFIPHIQNQYLASREEVIAAQNDPDILLVDAREARRYRGEWEPIDPVAGHIPGAVNLPWLELLPPQAYRERWQEIYQNQQKIICYCGSGVTACVNLLTLEWAGYAPGRLYVGGWSDWCGYPRP
ncbi:rhodanese-like domain protein [Gloeomargarita lithophora Alchichica-D10]|uniref:Rhodanese-like domain protein n=1 Tax=Gloeomargarita lithophora Alchichica-D10 TaxID=1188229 RepID=A0A1J0AFG0_9CYAN|nr:sulfurtransferase [Gloeomargarita lithophora]APB34676.1 rhodanese-like domain protein [Gloeomargarita lithophora Alchichica-D10]